MKLIIKIMLLVVWASQAYGQFCPPNHAFNNEVHTNIDYQAVDWITAANTKTIGDVTYKAGNYIELNEGFMTDNNAVFLAFIDGCDTIPEPNICPIMDMTADHTISCCYTLNLNNSVGTIPIGEIHIEIVDPPNISFDPTTIDFPIPVNNPTPQSLEINNNGNPIPSGSISGSINFCLNNSGNTPVTSQSFEIKYFDINKNEIDCRQQITEGCELIPCSLDWYTDPVCNTCVDRVEIIDYQDEKYVIFWGDSTCLDTLTIAYNYCDGTEFCKEGGSLNDTECSDLMPDLIKNHTLISTLWSQDADCGTNTCCANPCTFFDRVNAPVLTNAPDLGGCDLYITTVALGDCDQVTMDWGDGTVEGPFAPGNVALIHTYASTGTYEAIMYVKEIGENGLACWEGVQRFEVHAECVEERIEESQEVIFQNSPNPFTDQTTIEFTLTADAPVTLLVFDSMGRKIATLLDDEPITTGTHNSTFDGTDYPSGVYYYTIRAGAFFGTQKMILTK